MRMSEWVKESNAHTQFHSMMDLALNFDHNIHNRAQFFFLYENWLFHIRMTAHQLHRSTIHIHRTDLHNWTEMRHSKPFDGLLQIDYDVFFFVLVGSSRLISAAQFIVIVKFICSFIFIFFSSRRYTVLSVRVSFFLACQLTSLCPLRFWLVWAWHRQKKTKREWWKIPDWPHRKYI